MTLPCDQVLLSRLNENQLRDAILERRQVVRAHRDAMGDDRCWLDDYLVWEMIEGAPSWSLTNSSRADGVERCISFYRFRRSEAKDPVPADAVLDPAHWDDDLLGAPSAEMLHELILIQQAIRRHRDIGGRPLTVEDDRMLYAILPEKIPADFRLPPEKEFLGRAKSGAGCPAFWDSHQTCSRACNLHAWGPCT